MRTLDHRPNQRYSPPQMDIYEQDNFAPEAEREFLRSKEFVRGSRFNSEEEVYNQRHNNFLPEIKQSQNAPPPYLQ